MLLRVAHPAGSSIMSLRWFGFLSRLHGLSIDDLVEVEVASADGRVVIVNEDEDPGVLETGTGGDSRLLMRARCCRSLVGNRRCWHTRCCYQVHCKSIPRPCGVCGKSSLDLFYCLVRARLTTSIPDSQFHKATAPSLIGHFCDCVKQVPRELYVNVLLTTGLRTNIPWS